MIDPRTQGVLEAIIRRQGRSLLQYVGDSFPWTTNATHAALDRLREVVEEDRKSVAALVQHLARRRVTPPHFGSFPGWFTTINFVSLDHLLPLLVDEQRQEVASLEADLAGLGDEDASSAVRRVLDLKRRHLEALQAVATDRAAAAAPAPVPV